MKIMITGIDGQVGVLTTSKFIANQIKAILPKIKTAASGI